MRLIHTPFALEAPARRERCKCRRHGALGGPEYRGVAAAIVLQAAVFGFMHMNWVQGCYRAAPASFLAGCSVTTGKLRYTILLHFVFNAGSYLMGLLWFVSTPLDLVVTVGIAGFLLVEAMRSLLRLCIPVSREADRSE